MSNKTPQRVKGYVRVSDAKQIEGFSLDAQRAEIGCWCERKGHLLVGFYNDEGRSARTEQIEKRPDFQRMINDAKRGEFDIAVVHTIDRFSRNLVVQRKALAFLGAANVGFGSVREDMDFTTPHGRLVLNMMGSVAEFYSEQLGLHVSKAHRQKVDRGLPVGPTPFGYVQSAGGVPLVDCEKAEAIRLAFQRRALGESNASIANELNSRGLITKEGNRFTAHAIKDMFNCRFYVGVVTYKGEEFPGRHQAIVDEELFQAVQDSRHKGPSARRSWGPAGSLQGMVACGNCANAIQSDRTRFGAPMYRERHSAECFTNGRSAMAEAIDAQVGKILCSVELPSDWRTRMAELAVEKPAGPSLAELQNRRRRVGIAYADGAISEGEYRSRLKMLDDAIQESAGKSLAHSLEDAHDLFVNLEELWKEATSTERRKLLSPLIERVYVDMDLKLVGAIAPTPEFRSLMSCALRKAGSEVCLVSQGDLERAGVWRWWRRGRIELGFGPYQEGSRAVYRYELQPRNRHKGSGVITVWRST